MFQPNRYPQPNQQQGGPSHTHKNKFVDDLPEGYIKSGLHLWEQAGPLGKLALGAVAVFALNAWLNRK
jgi:hypothetical protein